MNNVLSALSMTLKKAVEWQVIEHMPCTVRLLKGPQGALGFYDFDTRRMVVVVVRLGKPFAHVETVARTTFTILPELKCGGGASGILVASMARDHGIGAVVDLNFLTKRLQDRFFQLVRGPEACHPEWLSFV